jgi:hypothetical protein
MLLRRSVPAIAPTTVGLGSVLTYLLLSALTYIIRHAGVGSQPAFYHVPLQ